MMMSASSTSFFALSVISSGSPGPKPTKYTVLVFGILLCHHDRKVLFSRALFATKLRHLFHLKYLAFVRRNILRYCDSRTVRKAGLPQYFNYAVKVAPVL